MRRKNNKKANHGRMNRDLVSTKWEALEIKEMKQCQTIKNN